MPPGGPATRGPGGAGRGPGIAALVLGIIAAFSGLLPFGFFLALPLAVIAAILAIVALRRNAARGQAITGLITAIVGIVGSVIWISVPASTPDLADSIRESVEQEIREASEQEMAGINIFDLGPGDCFDEPPGLAEGGVVHNVEVVPCNGLHDYEVFAATDYPDVDGYPGEDTIIEFGYEHCVGEAFAAYVGVDYPASRYYTSFVYPEKLAWLDNREIICFLFDEAPMEGSARNAGQ